MKEISFIGFLVFAAYFVILKALIVYLGSKFPDNKGIQALIALG